MQLHGGVAGILSDATLIVLVACHQDVALFSPVASPAAREEQKKKNIIKMIQQGFI